MERQSSRRRRPPGTQEPQPAPRKITTPQPKRLSGPLLSWAIIALLVLALAYPFRLDIHLQSWIGPLLGRGSGFNDETSIRPRIELHPEYHVYRAPVTHHLDWRVTTGERRPDGVLKQVFLINGEAPARGAALVGEGSPNNDRIPLIIISSFSLCRYFPRSHC